MTPHDSKTKGSFIIFVLDNHGILPSKINRRLPHLLINSMHLHNNTSLCNFLHLFPPWSILKGGNQIAVFQKWLTIIVTNSWSILMCTLCNMEFLPTNIAFKIKMHINQSRNFVLKNKKNKIKNTAKFCVMWEINQDKKFA